MILLSMRLTNPYLLLILRLDKVFIFIIYYDTYESLEYYNICMQNNWEILNNLQEKLRELEVKRDHILWEAQQNILNILSKPEFLKEAQDNFFNLTQEITKVQLQIALLSSEDTASLFWNVLQQFWIPLEQTEACIVSAEKNSTQLTSTTTSLRVRNKTPKNRTSLLSEILVDLGLFSPNVIQIAQSSQKKTKEDNYYFFYIPLLDKTILVSDYQEQATYICKGNYITKDDSIDKEYLWKNEIRMRFDESIKWKEDILYTLLPIDQDDIYKPNNSNLIQVRNKWYSPVRMNIWSLFDNNTTIEWSWREFLGWQTIGQAFHQAFSSSNAYKTFAQEWNNNENKLFDIPKTFKDMRFFFIYCKTDDARTLVEHGQRFKELILESKRLWRKLSLQEAKDCFSWLGEKTKQIIYTMFDNEDSMIWSWREFLKWEPIKKVFEEAFSSSERYKKFAQSWNACLDKPCSLPETFKQMRSVFIDCTPDQARKFVSHGLQFRWLILASKELWRKLSLQEAKDFCTDFVSNNLQEKSDTRELLWKLINDDTTTYSIENKDSTEKFQWTFQDAFKDIKTYELFAERWNNDSTHTIKLPTTRMLFYSLYIWWCTKNERNNLPKSPIAMKSLIVDPQIFITREGNKFTIEEAKQQMKDYRKNNR